MTYCRALPGAGACAHPLAAGAVQRRGGRQGALQGSRSGAVTASLLPPWGGPACPEVTRGCFPASLPAAVARERGHGHSAGRDHPQAAAAGGEGAGRGEAGRAPAGGGKGRAEPRRSAHVPRGPLSAWRLQVEATDHT